MRTYERKVSNSIGKGVNKTVNERLQTKWLNGENVLRQLQIIQIQHTYVKSSQKVKKIEVFGPTLLRNLPLKKPDFLGIFKNVLTGFYYIAMLII
jgi:hypothetical protein